MFQQQQASVILKGSNMDVKGSYSVGIHSVYDYVQQLALACVFGRCKEVLNQKPLLIYFPSDLTVYGSNYQSKKTYYIQIYIYAIRMYGQVLYK